MKILAVLASAAAFLTACADERPRVRATVADSSGVRITLSPDVDDLYAQVDSQPSVSLGGADADGPEQFYNIQGVHVDSAGNIWVANRGSNELRIFRADGSHWKTIGRRGDGPGEFRQIRLLGRARQRRVALWDDGNPRLTLVTPDADVDTVFTLTSGAIVPRDVAPLDGALLVRYPRVFAAGSLTAGAILPDTFALFRYDLQTNVVTPLATVAEPKWIWTGRHQIPVPFTIRAAVAPDSSSALHIAHGPDFRIRVLHRGALEESYGVRRPPRAVTDADRAVYRSFLEANIADSETLRAYLSGLDHPALPAQLPAYSQILLDDGGRTWALSYSPDLLASGSWDIYSPDRQLLGKVKTPRGLLVTAVVGNRIAGVWRDELGVEYVRLYPFNEK